MRPQKEILLWAFRARLPPLPQPRLFQTRCVRAQLKPEPRRPAPAGPRPACAGPGVWSQPGAPNRARIALGPPPFRHRLDRPGALWWGARLARVRPVPTLLEQIPVPVPAIETRQAAALEGQRRSPPAVRPFRVQALL